MSLENPYIASAALPGSGGWTAADPLELPASTKRVGFLVSYTGGAAGGAVKLRVRRGLAANALGLDQVVGSTVTVSGTVGSRAIDDAEFKRPVSDAVATVFAFEVDVSGWRFLALDLAEYGATGTPGTASVSATLGT